MKYTPILNINQVPWDDDHTNKFNLLYNKDKFQYPSNSDNSYRFCITLIGTNKCTLNICETHFLIILDDTLYEFVYFISKF